MENHINYHKITIFDRYISSEIIHTLFKEWVKVVGSLLLYWCRTMVISLPNQGAEPFENAIICDHVQTPVTYLS
jgi:hypothetical protein